MFRSYLKNSTETEKAKIVFQFAVMLIVSVIGGICFSNMLTPTAIQRFTAKLYISFNASSPEVSFWDIFSKIALVDIACILVLFVFSFSFINYVISDIVILFLGFRFGVNSAVIKLAGFEQLGIGNSLVFWIFKGVLLLAVVLYACLAAFKSLEFRKIGANRRTTINNKSLFRIILYTLSTIVVTLIIDGIYCLLIYVL